MKFGVSIYLLSLSVWYGDAAKCLTGSYVLGINGECNAANFVTSFKDAHERLFTESRCTHTLDEEIDFHLGIENTPTAAARESAVRDKICKKAWDSVQQIPFNDIAREDDESFEQLFYNGGTYWNEEVETNLESTDGDKSNHLRKDASRAKDFYQTLGQSAQVEWPDYMTNFSPDSCAMNAAYCCWPKDRQANDNNGNCKTPYDTNCFDKDPADNTDLCYNYAARGVNSTGHEGVTSMMYPGDNDNGEGAIHCHGFAWSNDPYDFTSRYKANNLFYVSMYDHLHQRGYAKETPGAPMCACAEQMPTATRSDCTQIDVDEKYKIKFSESTNEYIAELTYIEIDFNSCRGKNNRNNDLAAYVRRLVDEGKLTADQRYALSEYLVENNNCPMATNYHLESKHGLTTGYDAGDQWELIAGKDAFDDYSMGNSLFNTLYEKAPEKIFYRVCATCVESHQQIYYRRLTELPEGYDLFNALKNRFSNQNNVMGADFNLYSTLQDALDQTNEWTFCTYNSHIGMPAECGPEGKVRNQWAKMLWPGGRPDVAIYIMKDSAGSFDKTAISGGVDIGGPWKSGHAYEIDGRSYITSLSQGLWGKSDQFYFVPQSGATDIKLKVHILSLQGNTHSKAGLTIRESLDPKAKHIDCFQFGHSNGVIMQRREVYEDWTRSQRTTIDTSNGLWLQLEKVGDTYTCKWSTDGNNFSTGYTRTLDLGTDIKYGMAGTSSHTGRLAEVVYENFSAEDIAGASDAKNVRGVGVEMPVIEGKK